MKLFLLIVVLTLFVIGYFAYPLLRAVRASKMIEAKSTAYEQHPLEPTMRILVAGDSTGVGTGAQDARDSIAGRIGSDIPRADITNVSVNGLQLSGLHEILAELPKERRYDLMVLQIGANDIVGIGSLSRIEHALTGVLDEATDHADEIIVLTAGNIGDAPVFRYPLSRYVSWRTKQVRSFFMAEADARDAVTYIDLYRPSGEDVFNTDIPRYYAADRFHPSGEGYGVWYASVRPALPTLPEPPQAQDR